MSGNVYYVQCISGNPDHVQEVVAGTELEKACIARAEAGKLDALCLGPDDCPECVVDRREQARKDADYISMFGCPMIGLDDECRRDCPCRNPRPIPNSPYEGQVRYIVRTA